MLRLFAEFLAWPAVADWLIARAMRTPYDGLVVDSVGRVVRVAPPRNPCPGEHWYMRRFWLFRCRWFEARVHHIVSADPGRDMHDHPWPFRTFILRGWYIERRELGNRPRWLYEGRTATMGRGEFHRISSVGDGGCWTLFVTWGKRGGWGFKTAAGVVPHDEYHE